MMTRLADLSAELLIQRHANGIKLARPQHAARQLSVGNSLAEINSAPLNIYAYDLDNHMQFSNEQSSQYCGFISSNDVQGLHLTQILDKNSAFQLICNNQTIAKSNTMQVLDEFAIRKNGEFAGNVITFKFPLYNEVNAMAGVFGCSIPLNDGNNVSLSQALNHLLRIGLLNSPVEKLASALQGLKIGNAYFSKRECDVLFHVVRGKPAKEISQKLGISFRTVETHISNAKNKIGVRSKSELIEAIYQYF